jgi:uncharacterized protein YdeI (YjbR/CyaY-like superfamily)
MPAFEVTNTMTFTSPTELYEWLEVNHATESELLIKIFKKGSGIKSVTWNEVVIEVLCWGWIDGVKKSLDEHAYLQRITPRKARSNWSKKNTLHVEKLINEGRMKAPGLLHVNAAKADGRWDKAYTVSEMTVPADFISALDNIPQAKQFYQSLTKSHRCTIAYGLASAKKTETRQRRFKKYIDMLSQNIKPN